MRGALLLDEFVGDRPLDFFVLFASASALLGAPAQANYAAANAFLDGLARARHARGLPAVSVGWGPWDPALGGLTNGQAALLPRLASHGLALLDEAAARAGFEAALASEEPYLAAFSADWAQLAASGRRARLLLADLMRGAAADRATSGLAAELATLAPAARLRRVEQAVRVRVAASLGLVPDAIPPRAGFFDLGLDSLTALELRNTLQAEFRVTLPPTVALQHPTVEALTAWLVERLATTPAPQPTSAAPARAPEDDALFDAAAVAAVAQLSEAELNSLVEAELQALLR